MLEYVKRDGSVGRLFYDLAFLCKYFHARSDSGVQQRNPFSNEKEVGWMSVVNLPYQRDIHSGRKHYHGKYIILRETGVLSEISRQTGCNIKLCGDDFNVPVKYCDPYVWVWGRQAVDVDRAVQIVKDAIGYHMRNCSCHIRS